MAELGIFNAQSRLQDMLARRQEEQQLQRDQMSKLFGGAANTRKGQAANSVAAQIGSGFGQGLATGLFGEGQQIEQARENVETEQQLQQRLGQLDPDDPESYMKIGQELNRAGLTEQGIGFIEAGQKGIAKQRQKALTDETNDIVANFAVNPQNDELYVNALKATGDYEGLSELRKQKDQEAYSKYGKVARDLGYSPGSPEFIDYVSGAQTKDKANTESSLVGKINPQFYTPDSVAAFEDSIQMGTPDYGLLKEVDTLNPFAKQEQTKQSIKQIDKRNEKFAVQQNTNMKVQELQNLLDKGVETGITEDLLLPIKRLAGELTGAEFGEVPEQELFNALSNQLALMIRNPDSGMGLPGATSNRDIQFLTSSVSRLASTPEGNKLILNQYEKLYDFNKDLIDHQNKLIKENGGVVPFDLESKLSEYGANYELYDEQEKKEIIDAQVDSILSPETKAILNSGK